MTGFYFTKLVNGVPQLVGFEDWDAYYELVPQDDHYFVNALFDEALLDKSVSEFARERLYDEIFSYKEFSWLTPSARGVHSLVTALTEAHIPNRLINIINVYLSTLAAEAETPLEQTFYRPYDIESVKRFVCAYLDFHAHYCDSLTLETVTVREVIRFFELMVDLCL